MTLLRLNIFLSAALICALGFSGPSGAQVATTPAAPAPSGSLLPDVNPDQPPVEVVPVPVLVPVPAPTPKKDPCAAYVTSYEVYTVCQDRMHKIQNMIDAQKERETVVAPPVVPPAKNPGASAVTNPGGAPVTNPGGAPVTNPGVPPATSPAEAPIAK